MVQLAGAAAVGPSASGFGPLPVWSKKIAKNSSGSLPELPTM